MPRQIDVAALAGAPIVDPPIDWRASRAVGRPFAGRLVRGVQLPAQGVDFWTYDWGTRAMPNRPWRRWGTDRLVRRVLAVLRDFRIANPGAARVGRRRPEPPARRRVRRATSAASATPRTRTASTPTSSTRAATASRSRSAITARWTGRWPRTSWTASSRRAPATSGPGRASISAVPPASWRTSSTTTTTCTSGSADPARPAVSPRRCRGRPAGRRPRASRPASRRSAARGHRARRRSRAPPCARRRAACRCRAPPPRAR